MASRCGMTDLGGQAVLGEDRRGRAVGRADVAEARGVALLLGVVVDDDVRRGRPRPAARSAARRGAPRARTAPRSSGWITSRSISRRFSMATFSGRVTPPKVTMGAVARLRRSTWRRASALAMPSGSGSGCRMQGHVLRRVQHVPHRLHALERPQPRDLHLQPVPHHVRPGHLAQVLAHEVVELAVGRGDEDLHLGPRRRERVHRVRRRLGVLEADERHGVPAGNDRPEGLGIARISIERPRRSRPRPRRSSCARPSSTPPRPGGRSRRPCGGRGNRRRRGDRSFRRGPDLRQGGFGCGRKVRMFREGVRGPKRPHGLHTSSIMRRSPAMSRGAGQAEGRDGGC